MREFNAKKVAKVKAVDPEASYSVEGTDGDSFALRFDQGYWLMAKHVAGSA
tara:strand:+ start:157 stop:309 length:153 start_codon:yes stop_codon:yes gene_type:complete